MAFITLKTSKFSFFFLSSWGKSLLVEVALSGVEVKEDDAKPDPALALKVLPPWMIKQGMRLTKEQQGEVKSEDNKSEISRQIDEKKPKLDGKDGENKIQDEYIKAYYAALAERQRKHEEALKKEQQEAEGYSATTSTMPNGVAMISSERQIGMKVKREEEEDDDVKWESEPIAGTNYYSYLEIFTVLFMGFVSLGIFSFYPLFIGGIPTLHVQEWKNGTLVESF